MRISRSGLIRELNETRANCRRAGKESAARLETRGRLFGKGVDRGVLCLAAQVP